MKDVTKEFLKQSDDFGRSISLNITRVDMYVNKVNRIYKLRGAEQMWVAVQEKGKVLEKEKVSIADASRMVRRVGKTYFLNIYRRNMDDVVVLDITGIVPVKANTEDDPESEK